MRVPALGTRMSAFLCLRRFRSVGCKPARRPVDEQRNEDEHGRGHKADRVGEQDRLERPVHREDGLDPEDTHAANAEERQNGRGERDAEAAQIARQDLIRQREDI